MRSWGDVNAKCAIPFDFLRFATNKPKANKPKSQTLDREFAPLEISPIPQLLDENGRDLLSERPSTEMQAIERQWSNDNLRRFDRFWYGPSRSQFPNRVREGSVVTEGGASSRTSMSSGRRYSTSDSHVIEHNATVPNQPSQTWNIRGRSLRLLRKPATRFYKPKILQETLLGPENYKHWAVAMERTLRQCAVAWELEGDIMLALVYGESSSQWTQFNPNIWMVIFSNVSSQIQQDLSDLGTSDAHEAWQFLEKTCGGDVPLRVRSVKGVRDIMNIRYDKCSSLKEYLRNMMLCIRAIECNPHGEKENQRREGGSPHGGTDNEGVDNEWLWCQFILVNLGPEWESWISELLEKSKDGEPLGGAIRSLGRLFHIIEAEEARRIQASR